MANTLYTWQGTDRKGRIRHVLGNDIEAARQTWQWKYGYWPDHNVNLTRKDAP